MQSAYREVKVMKLKAGEMINLPSFIVKHQEKLDRDPVLLVSLSIPNCYV